MIALVFLAGMSSPASMAAVAPNSDQQLPVEGTQAPETSDHGVESADGQNLEEQIAYRLKVTPGAKRISHKFLQLREMLLYQATSMSPLGATTKQTIPSPDYWFLLKFPPCLT